MTGDHLERLLDVLEVEERIHREMRQLLGRERECMLELDAPGLYELARRKDALADEGRLAEGARIEAARRLAEALGISELPVTLSRLVEALGDEGGALREAQSRLVALVSAAQELAEANRLLGGDRLERVQTTLRLLGRLLPDSDPGTYGADTRTETTPSSSRLVRTQA